MFRSLKFSSALVGLLTALVAVVPPAYGADITISNTPGASWRLNGRVYASVIVGNEIILGGAFTRATSPTGTVVARQHLAAFNLATGALVTTFQADANNTVRALVSDGSTVWVGGLFTHIGASNRSRLAAIDASTGAVRAGFAPDASAAVRGLDLRAGRLFVGGNFTSLDGRSRGHAGAVDPQTGAVDLLFRPAADNEVTAVRANPGGTTVYLAGDFTRVNGTARDGVAAVNATGANSGTTTGTRFANSISPALGLDMNPAGTVLFGAEGALGTDANNVDAWNVATGARIWHLRTDGDIQAIRYAAGNVYFGFHDGYQLDGSSRLLAVDATTGALDRSFRPGFNMFWGVFTIAVSDNYVVAGGEFSRISGVAAGGWARFPITSAPTASFSLAMAANGIASFNGGGSTDSNGTIASYAWDYGDGSTGTGVSPVHAYSDDGDYNATLTVTDNSGTTASTTQPVHVSGAAVGSGALVLAVPAAGGAAAVGAKALVTTSFNAVVRSVVHRGSTIYVGGEFTRATDSTGTHTRKHVAAISAKTGRLLPWNPATNGTVFGLAAAKDGVFIGGQFTRVRGHAIRNLAKVSPVGKGFVKSKFHHRINRAVHAVALGKKTVYIGGDFGKIDGKRRVRLAALNRTGDYALTPWRPRATHSTVEKIKVAKEGIFVAGKFRGINGSGAAQRLALLRKSNGRVVTSFNAPVIDDAFDITLGRHRVYVAVGGRGGHLYSLARKTGRLQWRRTFDGDVQAVTLLDGLLYVGGQFGQLCKTDRTAVRSGDCVDGGKTRLRLAALHLGGGLTSWHPGANSRLGVLSMDSLPKRNQLAVGGAFTAFDDIAIAGQ